jgi:hypothetical protein
MTSALDPKHEQLRVVLIILGHTGFCLPRKREEEAPEFVKTPGLLFGSKRLMKKV